MFWPWVPDLGGQLIEIPSSLTIEGDRRVTHSVHIMPFSTYYYNRRVPKHAVKAYGPFIGQALSKCPEEAEPYAKRLGTVLEGSWSNRQTSSQ